MLVSYRNNRQFSGWNPPPRVIRAFGAHCLEPIPRPPGHLLVGNLLDIDAAHPIESLAELAREYGPIFELAVPGGSRFVVSGFELVDRLCDESRFDKKVAGGLRSLAEGPTGRGLFKNR